MDKEIQRLIEMYTVASENIQELINVLVDRGLSRKAQEKLLREIQAIINQLTETAGESANSIITQAYMNGSEEAINTLLSQGVQRSAVATTVTTVIHVRAVQEIVDETFYRILENSDHMTGDAKKRIKNVVQEANRRSLIEGVSRRQATKDAVAEMNQKGITGMIAKNGAEIPAEKYMANVIQYHQRKAHVDGVVNRLVDNKRDLVYVNHVGITCPVCAIFQGRVYSVSGNDSRFPPLEQRPPYHGHCVHNVSVWTEEYMDEEEIGKAIADSNRPFEDNRTAANKKKYEEMQRETSQKNETRKQWIRYKARMPGMPDLRTFASHKARNTKKYQGWMEDFRRFGYEIKSRSN
ncbi:phage minor capsid protein [Bacillus mesophilum]|uniref:Minor capsid protein n=1 Tax=Bacillus mesophilum TaxID=1071718 RepID=A0A7V7RP90_9BACI|nr:phage minor capsid protein [Bacillus mesophilum]KAB2335078.1 minor capsid protein [Bacillus mesophilum]